MLANFGAGHGALVFVIAVQETANQRPLQNAPARGPSAGIEHQHVDALRIDGIQRGAMQIRSFLGGEPLIHIAEDGIAQSLRQRPRSVNGLVRIDRSRNCAASRCSSTKSTIARLFS